VFPQEVLGTLNRELREQIPCFSWLQVYNRSAVLLEKTKTATTLTTFFRAHKRAITFSLVAFCAFRLSRGALHHPYFLPYFAVFVMLIFSQLFWIGLVVDFGERFIPGKLRRIWLTVIATVVWVFFFRAYNFIPRHIVPPENSVQPMAEVIPANELKTPPACGSPESRERNLPMYVCK